MNRKIFHYVFPWIVALALSGVAHWRGNFSLNVISIPLETVGSEINSLEISERLKQPYHFLGKGRQSFAFESEDGKTVLKFFNRTYFQMPWYSFALYDEEKERKKRGQREAFYRESYRIAEEFLSKQTGLLYVHLGSTKELPRVDLKDQTGRIFSLDLNRVPFVLQRKGTPFYRELEKIRKTKGDAAFLKSLNDFLEMIAYRISLGISDRDHDVEHNFGFLDEKPFHLDPGRLCFSDFSDSAEMAHEWWAATHSLRKWVEGEHPDLVLEFDHLVEANIKRR